MKFKDFRPPRLVKGPKRWYIEYYTRIPVELREYYYNKNWFRIKVFNDINHYQGEEQEEYAKYLLKSVQAGLKDGLYTPFTLIMQALEKEVIEAAKPKELSLSTALDKFMDQCKDKGLRENTLQNYGTVKNYLVEYFLKKNNKIYGPISSFTKEDMKGFIRETKVAKEWSNSTFNNYLGFAKTIFNWFIKEDMLVKNPLNGIDTLLVNITRHKYYDHKTAQAMKDEMSRTDPYMFKFCQFVYYTGMRPKSEVPALKVENILADRNLIFIPAHVSKNKKDDYIHLDPTLKSMLEPWLYYPKNYYLFSQAGHPSLKIAPANYFGNRYLPFKRKFKLSVDYTLYSWKHTRAIDLAEAGANPYEIMSLFRHHSLEMTIKYLRGMGCNISAEVSEKSKKF